MNSRTSRPRSPIRAITLTSAAAAARHHAQQRALADAASRRRCPCAGRCRRSGGRRSRARRAAGACGSSAARAGRAAGRRWSVVPPSSGAGAPVERPPEPVEHASEQPRPHRATCAAVPARPRSAGVDAGERRRAASAGSALAEAHDLGLDAGGRCGGRAAGSRSARRRSPRAPCSRPRGRCSWSTPPVETGRDPAAQTPEPLREVDLAHRIGGSTSDWSGGAKRASRTRVSGLGNVASTSPVAVSSTTARPDADAGVVDDLERSDVPHLVADHGRQLAAGGEVGGADARRPDGSGRRRGGWRPAARRRRVRDARRPRRAPAFSRRARLCARRSLLRLADQVLLDSGPGARPRRRAPGAAPRGPW